MAVRWKKYENPNSELCYGCDGEIGEYAYECTIFATNGKLKWFVDISPNDGPGYYHEGVVRGTTPKSFKKAKIRAMASCQKFLEKDRARIHREYVRNLSHNRKMTIRLNVV